jgi:cytochrome P450
VRHLENGVLATVFALAHGAPLALLCASQAGLHKSAHERRSAVATAPAAPRPAHVPEELVVTLPLYARQRVYECPQETMIPQLHAALPPISYVTNIFPGDQPGWLLKGYDDTMTMLRDPDNFTKNGMGKWAQNIGEDWLVIPTEADPPIHTGYRMALNPKFAPQKMAALRDQVRERARVLIDKFKDRGTCDFVDEFSEKYIDSKFKFDLLN